MGIETLRSAERAAGFAMVDVEEPPREGTPSADQGRRIGTPALLLQDPSKETPLGKDEASFGDWIKHILGAPGGRAPA